MLWALLLLGTARAQLLGCPLRVTVDPFLWAEHRAREGPGEEGGPRTRTRIIALVSRLVSSANSVLAGHRLAGTSYRLVLQDIQILQEADCLSLGFDLCSLDLTLAGLLDGLSHTNQDAFCLSYLLTYRDFPGGSLGLAWTAAGRDGGVCETHRPHAEVVGGSPVNKSLNTGVVTLSRGGRPVSDRVAALAFTHEVAHSFGAPHDSAEAGCPVGPEGEHLMAATGSLGRRAANMRLSPCSLAAMARLLPGRTGCWVSPGGAVCGNSVVEGGEECDCGTDPALCQALCCVPSSGDAPCSRAPGAVCSPTEGLCCSSSCALAPRGQQCAAASECALPALCTGTSPLCPLPPPRPEGRPCQGGARTCAGGSCSGSACQGLGLLPCPAAHTNDSLGACQAHCEDREGRCAAQPRLVYPEGEECRAGAAYGHCSAEGACSLRPGPRGWMAGLTAFLAVYLLLGLAAGLGLLSCYCRYCRGGRRG